ncbi:tail fiber protein [Salinibacterium sp. SYSU T00001]|uniref:phage tail protein n=1 Tax=Homoserinimonas sedimenticola TaxID=2986805 RepID=UPI0022364B4B|nr:tail fiber protein [Salinibacterium sedimenticola]MCW4385531.1 tail fiber protein [Salinibacterium sedimenticola]
MADPFVAEIRIFPFNFAPKGWAFCNGQLIPISQNTALFSLLGTTYGGDGKSTFALPDLQGRIPLQAGQGAGLSDRWLGDTGGESAVALHQTELPPHRHTARALNDLGDTNGPASAAWASPRAGRVTEPSYGPASASVTSIPAGLAPTGGGLPHNNLPPYLTLHYCIALQGVFPPRP